MVRVTVWPIVLLVVLIVYRRAISKFLTDMGGRVSRVSFGGASVEFAFASEAPSAMVSAVTEFIDATSAAGGMASDDGSSLQTAIHSTGADFVKIDLRGGRGWLTSRLYIFSVILSETAGVKKLVFVQRDDAGTETFVGVANPLVVADRLGSRFRWLSYALAAAELPEPNEEQLSGATELVRPFTNPQRASRAAKRYLIHPLIRTTPYPGADGSANQFNYSNEGPPAAPNPPAPLPAAYPPPPCRQMPTVSGINPATGPHAGGTLVTIAGQGFGGLREVRFGNSPAAVSIVTDIQIVATSPPGDGNAKVTVVTPAGSSTATDDWVTIQSSNGSLHAEHAAWIRNGQHLRSLIGGAIDMACITETSSTKRSDIREQILRGRGDFVAVVDQKGQFRRLIDRRAVIERLAKETAESPS